jgi:hypothetical protein
MRSSSDPLFEQFRTEFAALVDAQEPIILQLTPQEAWAVLCNIQLAARHPRNTGITRILGQAVAHRIQSAVATTPALKEIAERGWHPQFDK